MEYFTIGLVIMILSLLLFGAGLIVLDKQQAYVERLRLREQKTLNKRGECETAEHTL